MSDPHSVLGIHEIDEVLFPILPPGWIALLTGTPGSGAQLMAKQFAHAGVGLTPVLFYTTYERSEDVRKAYNDRGWDPDSIHVVNLADEYYDRVLVRGLEVSRVRERGLRLTDLTGGASTGPRFESFNLTSRMLADLALIDTPFRMVVDSLDFFLEVLEPRDVTTVARQIRQRCQTLGGQALLSLHTTAGQDQRILGLLEDIADIVIETDATPHEGHHEHSIALRKVTNHPEFTRVARAEVTQSGLQVAAGLPRA